MAIANAVFGSVACHRNRSKLSRLRFGSSSKGSGLAEDEVATYLWVAETVLRKHRRPLRARELVNYGLEDALFSDQELSRTPQKSMQARLSMDILASPEGSSFVRTSRGQFYLRELLTHPVPAGDGDMVGAAAPLSEYTAIRREAPPASENVLVIHKDNYEPLLGFQGIGIGKAGNANALLRSKITNYMPRTRAETVEDHKQVITYTLIQHRSKVLSFTRGNYNRAATFLRGSRCLGFGGHVTDSDHTLFSYGDLGIRANAAREISEEIMLPTGRPNIDPDQLEILGVLNDDSSDVGRRHVAIVLRYWVDDFDNWKRVSRGENSINQLRWLDTSAEPINLSEFEYWSQICVWSFFPNYLNMIPRFRIVRKAIFRKPHVLCVVGEIGSGKSATTTALVENGGYTQINSGQVLATLLQLAPVPETPREQFQEAAERFIITGAGPKRLADALLKAANATNADRVVIDGIRHPETLAELREQSDAPVAVIYVYTPPDVAYDMYRFRENYSERDISFRDFVTLYNAPVEGRIKYVLGEADVVLYNWLGYEQYLSVTIDMMKAVGVFIG